MQFDRIPFARICHAVDIRQSQNAVLVGKRSEVLDRIRREPEPVRAVRIERDLRSLIIRRDRERFERSCRGFGRPVERTCRDRVVAGQLFAGRSDKVQFQRIAFGNRFRAVGVDDRQLAIRIGVGAELFDGIASEPEAERAVRIECDLRSLVIRRDRNAFRSRRFRSLLRRALLRRRFRRSRFDICGDRIVTVQRPDGLGDRVEDGGIFRGIIFAVRHLGVSEQITCRTSHLAGISVEPEFEYCVACRGGRDCSVVVEHIGAFGVHRGDHTESRVVADHGALARLDAVRVGQERVSTV